MSETREEKLATFQYITGVTDINKAIVLLESVDWDLPSAMDIGIIEINDESEEDSVTVVSNSSPCNADIIIDIEADSDIGPMEIDSEVSVSRRRGPLIPENVEDELKGSIIFIDNFISLYGQNSPPFYAGTLEDATKEAFFQPARQKRMLGIYLHHVESVFTNVFCTQILSSEDVTKLLDKNMVLWGWDVSVLQTKRMYLESAERYLGVAVRDAINRLGKEQYPIFIAVSRFRAQTDVRMIVYGNIDKDEFLTRLTVSIEDFEELKEMDIREEDSRVAREKLKAAQDEAYKESLEIDRAKAEEARQKLLYESQEEERRRTKEEEERTKREEERLSVESSLPEEPLVSSPDPLVTLKFHPPNGKVFQRKFFLSSSLELVFNFLLSRGYRLEEYRLISSWPRKDLSSMDRHVLLVDLGLSAHETLLIEQR